MYALDCIRDKAQPCSKHSKMFSMVQGVSFCGRLCIMISLLYIVLALGLDEAGSAKLIEGVKEEVNVDVSRQLNIIRRPTAEQIKKLQADINYKFNNTDTLYLALTHSSYSEYSNRRLRFVGAEVIRTALALQAFEILPMLEVKEMNTFVNLKGTLKQAAQYATSLGLAELVMTGKSVKGLPTNLSSSDL